MPGSAQDRKLRDHELRTEVLRRAAELMDSPIPLKDITIGQVSKRSSIAASTILSQSALKSVDDDGRAEVFRKLLFRRLVSEVTVRLAPIDRDNLITAARAGLDLASIVQSLIATLSDQLVAAPQSRYLLTAARHRDDPLLSVEVAAKWNEITAEPSFLVQLLAAAAGYDMAPAVELESIQAGLALALSVEFMHQRLLPELDQLTFCVDGVDFGAGALVFWGLLAQVLQPRSSDVRAFGQVGLVRNLDRLKGIDYG